MRYTIVLTNRCNLFCKMCPRHYLKMEPGDMSLDIWLKCLSQVELGSTILPFWRGESTLHPQFTEFIKIAALSVKDLQIVLATNGTNIEPILRVLGIIDVVNVSLHTDESVEGCRTLIKQRDRKKLKTKIIGSLVDSEKNPNLIVTADLLRVYKEHTIKGQWGKVKGVRQKKRPGLCERLTSDIVVAYNGAISRCCYVWETEPPLGHAGQITLHEIKNRSKFLKLSYPDWTSFRCDQWRGEGKTL